MTLPTASELATMKAAKMIVEELASLNERVDLQLRIQNNLLEQLAISIEGIRKQLRGDE